MSIRVSAPGKLVLFGEYSVLFGAPAAVMAVNRRAIVELIPSVTKRWTLDAPGLAHGVSELDFDSSGRIRWFGDERRAREQFHLVERMISGLTAAEIVEFDALNPAATILDTQEFFDRSPTGRLKLGLGSSAALTVAFASALIEWSGARRPPDSVWLQTLVDLHREMQNGHGSGIDVAASVLGGVVRFQIGVEGAVTSASPLSLPKDLHLQCVWTGRSASTGAFLEGLKARQKEDPAAVERALDRLAVVSAAGIDTLEIKDSKTFLDLVGEFWDGLENLSRVIGLPILSDEHRSLRRIAGDCGAFYKPSGAGGGDIGLVLASDLDAVECVMKRASAEGFVLLDLEVDPSGVSAAISW